MQEVNGQLNCSEINERSTGIWKTPTGDRWLENFEEDGSLAVAWLLFSVLELFDNLNASLKSTSKPDNQVSHNFQLHS